MWVGWAAVGDGWAVYARTVDEALRRFSVLARRQEEDRPDVTERVELAESAEEALEE